MALTLNPEAGSLVNLTTYGSEMAMSYTRNTGTGRWIYLNYPEPTRFVNDDIAGNIYGYGPYATGDNNYFLTRQNIPAGTHQIFYSLQNVQGLNNLKFQIRLYNGSGSSVNYTRYNHGHRQITGSGTTPFKELAGPVWKDFFSSSQQAAIPVTTTPLVIHDYPITNGYIFTGNTRFYVNGPVTLAAYLYTSSIPSNPVIYPTYIPKKAVERGYPNDPRYYSGFGSGWLNQATINLSASTIGSGKYFKINNPAVSSSLLSINGAPATTDLVPICINKDGNDTTYYAQNGANLGNWSFQNLFTVNFTNPTNSPVTFYGFVKADTGAYPVIQQGSTINYAKISGGNANAWRFFSKLIPANTNIAVQEQFQFINGTNSGREQLIVFKTTTN